MSNNGLLENPAELLREVRESFIIEQDVESLFTIDKKIEQIKTKSQEKLRDKKLEISRLEGQLKDSESRVESLNSNLSQIKKESQDLVGKNHVVDFVKELDELEQSIVDMRSELNEKVSKFVQESQSSSSNNILGSEGPQDEELQSESLLDPQVKADLLKLKLYRSLQVFIDDVNGQVMIEGKNNEINTLPLDDEFSDYFKTKYIWERVTTSR